MPPKKKPIPDSAKQAFFMEPVTYENATTVLHIRYCAVIAVLALALFFTWG